MRYALDLRHEGGTATVDVHEWPVAFGCARLSWDATDADTGEPLDRETWSALYSDIRRAVQRAHRQRVEKGLSRPLVSWDEMGYDFDEEMEGTP